MFGECDLCDEEEYKEGLCKEHYENVFGKMDKLAAKNKRQGLASTSSK